MSEALRDDPRGVRRARKRRDRERPNGLPAASVDDAVRSCLTGITYLVRRDPLPPLDVIYGYARSSLQSARLKLEGLPIGERDMQDIYYALVAYIDEVMQTEDGALKEFWQAHLLQLEYFGETRAGEGFFDRLERARSEERRQVVRVYYVCLLLGFRGVYQTLGDLERENLIVTLRDTLGASDPAHGLHKLSPFGERPNEPGLDRRRNALLDAIAVCSLVLSIVFYAGLYLVTDARTEGVIAQLTSAYEDLAAPPARAER